MNKIISITITFCVLFSLCGCKSSKSESFHAEKPILTEKSSEYTSEDAENDKKKTTTVQLGITITNSTGCDMNYSLSIPDWNCIKEYVDTDTKYDNNTRIYQSNDPNLYFFVTEYNGWQKYIGDIDKSFGKNSYSEASGVQNICMNAIINNLDIYNDYCILAKEPIKIGDNIECYEFCLQYPYGYNPDFHYAKGYIAVGIKHPVAVYFYDGTEGTIYDNEMMTKSLECIKTLVVEKQKENDENLD